MRALTNLLLPLLITGCALDDDVGRRTDGLEAYCSAMVRGVGSVDIETDYLARVVNCENGNAAFEALKAQAVAARTYLYYKLDTAGSIADGTSDQVYSCGREPRAEHYEAVNATRGIVLQYAGETIAGFFVAGSRQTPPDCMGGTDDPTNTERYVTYNQGLTGDDLEQTILGWVNPGNIFNRGCLSQNGSHCLAMAGWSWEDMVHFYYGADIEIVRTEGPCGSPVDAGTPDAGFDAGVDAALPDVGVDTGVDAAVPIEEPSVAVRTPSGDTTPRALGSGCSTSGSANPWPLVALLALARKRR